MWFPLLTDGYIGLTSMLQYSHGVNFCSKTLIMDSAESWKSYNYFPYLRFWWHIVVSEKSLPHWIICTHKDFNGLLTKKKKHLSFGAVKYYCHWKSNIEWTMYSRLPAAEPSAIKIDKDVGISYFKHLIISYFKHLIIIKKIKCNRFELVLDWCALFFNDQAKS